MKTERLKPIAAPANKVNLNQDGAAIRKAWKAGQKTVMLHGVRFRIKHMLKRRKVIMGGQNAHTPYRELKFTDRWLVARPVEGMLPVYCIEEVAGRNGVARAK